MKTLLFFVCFVIILCLVSRDWKTIKRMMSVWGIVGIIDFLYDFPFWMWMQSQFGVVVGSMYASLGALVINLGLIIWYQSCGEDWLGVNILEQIKREGKNWSEKMCNSRGLFLRVILYLPATIFKLVVWSLNKTELTTFLVFSIFTDSFKTTMFMRHGRVGELDWRDLRIFVLSTVISCTQWSIISAALGGAVRFIYAMFR